MKFIFKHILLAIGLVTIATSFLFFGRNQDMYGGLVMSGSIISFIIYLAILFSSESLKSKLLCTTFAVLSVIAISLAEPFLIDTSYRIFINQNKNQLLEINKILETTKGDITVLNDSVYDGNLELSKSAKLQLLENRKKLNVYLIAKTETSIYYGLWGFLDVRLGIRYFIKEKQVDSKYRYLIGNWFH